MIYEIEKDDVKLEIWRDEDPMSPREWDNLGTIFASSRYTIGEVDVIKDVLIDLDLTDTKYERLVNTYDLNEITDEIEAQGGITLPIYIYDHGGIKISTSQFSCGWDSGRLGFIYVLRSTILREFGWKRISKTRIDKVKYILQSEIDELDQYLQGDIWGFTLTTGGDVDESCGGFYDVKDMELHLPDEGNELLKKLMLRENL